MSAPKKRGLPKPLPDGFILTDNVKKKWRLGKVVGQGGFGLIYYASQDIGSAVSADTDFVVKVEYHENGPLFCELSFYKRAGRPEMMQKWMQSKRLDHLGIPKYWASGQAEYNGIKYRFMVMERLGTDLQKISERNGGRFKKATVLRVGQVLVDILEYIHENEFVHADIKASNLMLGHRNPQELYLADYGLANRYCNDGVQKQYHENHRKGHDGTIEYTSLDAHRAGSRRGDIQILGFCLLHWLCGSLPWDGDLKNAVKVMEAKDRLMDSLPESVQQLSVNGASTAEVASLLLYVKSLNFHDKPDYQRLRQILSTGTKEKLDFSVPRGVGEKKSASKALEPPNRGKARCSSTKHQPAMSSIEVQNGQRKAKGQGVSKAKPVAIGEEDDDEEDDDEEDEGGREKKLKQASCNRRRQNVPQKSDRVTRSLRSRAGTLKSYKEDDSTNDDDDEEEEEKEEDVRSNPIDPRYIRGPPKGKRGRPKMV
ncbi:serine/threonine-protein kinase VRK2 isoform X2 [Corythoichthys intestinalis]|uniref:serine/threonine-protein kinase VRK2 isoform X2 n=1 Tax=Corythoichthys intestinalis TaxID=161448 RepID=UPI0025A5A2DD|nr:serine/threonine-protein kinase VRK2 isoform X2 [Corythoichthys intestinalis]